MKIAGYIKTSLIEWPGKISSVIFVPGCNFRCPFCHNADLVDLTKIDENKLLKEQEVTDNLKKRKKWTDAVVVTGGEPTMQEDLLEFLGKLKGLLFSIMLHTNGTNPGMIKKILGENLADFIAIDLKGDFEEYEKYTRAQRPSSGEGDIVCNLQKTIGLVMSSKVKYEFRTTVVPGLHDLDNLKQLARQILRLVKRSKSETGDCRWYLQQFRPANCYDQKFLLVEPFSKREMEGLRNRLQKIIPQTFLRGV